MPNTRALLPYFDDYWREHVLRRGLERENFEPSSYPANAPINGRPDWRLPSGPPGSSLAAMQTHLLDRLQPSFAICNVIHGAQVMLSEDLSAAFCRAINNWIRAEWLDRDPRLRASIVVPPHSADLAAEEIERLAADRRFVQVLLLAMTELPLGRRQNWPIYKAAEEHGLPIGIHAGSSFRHPPSAGGWPSYYLEDYVSQAQGFAGGAEQPGQRGRVREIPRPEGRADRVRRDLAAGLAVAARQDLARRAGRSAVAGAAADRDRARACPPDAAAVRRAAHASSSCRRCWSSLAPTRCCCSPPTIRTGTSTATTRCRPACRPT